MKKLLRSPKLIVFEVSAIAMAGALGAAIPQAGVDAADNSTLMSSDGAVMRILETLGLDSIFTSYWFVALIALAGISLTVVIYDQVRMLPRKWKRKLTEKSFDGAPLRIEFERPARGEQGVKITTTSRVGLLGSPLFHMGLLLVIIAGVVRSLFGVDAMVDLIEGEILAPTADGWSMQWVAPLAGPLSLNEPLTLESVDVGFYESAALESLDVKVTIGEPGNTRSHTISVNEDLAAPGARLFLSSEFGPAALVEWTEISGKSIKTAQMLSMDDNLTEYVGSVEGPGEKVAHFRAFLGRDGSPKPGVSFHVMKNGALLKRGIIEPGRRIDFDGGESLVLHGLPMWSRINGSVDLALWLAYLGFALSIIGSLLLFAVIRVDTCVAVVRQGDVERVTVAFRALRFAPLYTERFEKMVKKEGGGL